MFLRRQPLAKWHRKALSFQRLEDRRVLAATSPDFIELTNALGANIYSGGFEQRAVVAPQYVTDAQGNRTIDLRVDVPGNQTVVFPSIGIDDDGPYSVERASRVVRILVNPNETYVITSGGSDRAEKWSVPVSAFNAAGELLERLVIPVDYDPGLKVSGSSRGYIGDVGWHISPSLKLPPQTASIVASRGAITSIGFLSDEYEGAMQTVRWGDEPLLVSKQPVDFIEADDPIAIDPAKVYTLEVDLNAAATVVAKHSAGYTAYDRDGLLIEPQHFTRHLNATDTTLASELRAGDTFIELVDASGWSNLSSDPATRSLAWYGYQDSSGQTYANYSYTRNVATDPGLGLWAAGAVVGNRIALLKPWAGPTLPSGLAVRNAVAGSSLFAVLADDQLAPFRVTREIVGTWQSGTQNPAAFPPGTAAIRPAVELNQALTISGKTQLTYRVATNKSPSLTGSSTRVVTIDPLANDTGVGERPRILDVTEPKFGQVEIVIGTSGRPILRYTAVSYFVGVDRFTYRVASDNGNTFTEQVSVSSLGSNLESNAELSQRVANYEAGSSVNIINQFFLASSTYEVLQGEELVINSSLGPRIAEDLGEGSMPVFVSLLAGPSRGSMLLEPDGAFRYIAEPNYTGDVGFLVNISNGTQSLDVLMGFAVRGTAAEVDQSKLGKIGLAEEVYYGVQQQYFYPMVPGQPQLSWRVHALPYLGYSKLHSQFRFDEPWDSANNLPLAAQMPEIYRSTGDAADNTTRFQTIVAPQSNSPTKHWLTANATPRARRGNATHGEGNAILVLQTAPQHAVIWTKPDDLLYTDAQSTLAKLTAPLFPAYFWFPSTGSPSSAILVPRDITTSQFQSIATISESPGVVGVDVASLARGWAERPDTPATLEQFGVPKSTFNIRAISIALANFESAYKLLPQASMGPNPSERTPVSWRVQILPFIGQSELYARYRLNEPWNSPANLSLLNEMPDVFRSANDPSTSNKTRIRFLDGTDTAHDRSRTRLKLADFLDGLSNTILFVEAGVDKAVPWTQPEALPIDMANIWGSLGNLPDGFMRIGMGDEYVGMVGTASPNADMSALLTIGLARLTSRPREELYDGLTLIRRSGMTVAVDAFTSLRWIGHAALNFASAYGRLPSNIYAPSSPTTPLISWRVAILPFLEADRLYQQFRLDEPWSSPHNLALMEYMPAWLRGIGDPSDSTETPHQSFVGTNSFINSTGKPVRWRDLLKGTSNILAYVQTGRDQAVPWTKPSDVDGDAVDIWKELGQVGKTAPFVMADTTAEILTRTGTGRDSLNGAANIGHELTRTIIAANTLVIREGDFARVDLIHQGIDEILEMDPQSYLTMTPRMTFAAAENNTLDGTRKVQLRWGKRSDPTNPNSPLIVSQTLDVYVIDNESLTLRHDAPRVFENNASINFTVTRGQTDTSNPLPVEIRSNSSHRIQFPTSVVIPAGQSQVTFTAVTFDNSDIEGPVAVQVTASAAGYLDHSAYTTINDDDTLKLTIAPSELNESQVVAVGTVSRLFGSLDAPLTVKLSSSDTGIARVAFQVTIPAGRAAANFTITAMPDPSYDGSQVVTIVADAGTYGRNEQQLTVNDFAPLSLSSAVTTMSERGEEIEITVVRGDLGLDVPLVVQLNSSDETELTVPASIIIPANARSATFLAKAIDDFVLDQTQAVTITARSSVFDPGSIIVNVRDYEELSLSLIEQRISENGGTTVGRIMRGNTNTSLPIVVSLRTTPSNSLLEFPASIVIPGGATFVDFEIRAIDDRSLAGDRLLTLIAENESYVPSSVQLVVTDHEELTIDFDEARISEVGLLNARVHRSNTNIDEAIIVSLEAITPGTLQLPTFVTIPAGSEFASFTIEGIDNLVLEGSRTAEVQAVHVGYQSIVARVEVTDFEPLELQLSDQQQYEGAIITGQVTRNVMGVSESAVVAVSLFEATRLIGSSTVTIPANASAGTFEFALPSDHLREGGMFVTVEVQSLGYVSASAQVDVLDFEALWHNFRNPLDVNDDGEISPLDALLVINFLSTSRGPVSDILRPSTSPQFLDTSDDQFLSPRDALLVINHLGSRANGEANGEFSSTGDSRTLVDQAVWQLLEEEQQRRKSTRHRSN